MIEMFNGVSGEMIGHLTEFQLDELLDRINDGSGDETYIITRAILNELADSGLDEQLLDMLATAMEKQKEIRIQFHILDEADIDFGAEEE